MYRMIRSSQDIEAGLLKDAVTKFISLIDSVAKSLGKDHDLESNVIKENPDGSRVIQIVRKDGRKLRTKITPKDNGKVDIEYKADTGNILNRKDTNVPPEDVSDTIAEVCEEDEHFSQGTE